MQDGQKVFWSIPYVSGAFFPSLKQNFIAYHSSKVSSCPDCIFEIHQLWQSGFSRVYSNCCGSCWFEAEIIKIGQSSHKMYSNNIVNFQESTTILNACTKRFWKLIECTTYISHCWSIIYTFLILIINIHLYIYICVYVHIKCDKKLFQDETIKINNTSEESIYASENWTFFLHFYSTVRNLGNYLNHSQIWK